MNGVTSEEQWFLGSTILGVGSEYLENELASLKQVSCNFECSVL